MDVLRSKKQEGEGNKYWKHVNDVQRLVRQRFPESVGAVGSILDNLTHRRIYLSLREVKTLHSSLNGNEDILERIKDLGPSGMRLWRPNLGLGNNNNIIRSRVLLYISSNLANAHNIQEAVTLSIVGETNWNDVDGWDRVDDHRSSNRTVMQNRARIATHPRAIYPPKPQPHPGIDESHGGVHSIVPPEFLAEAVTSAAGIVTDHSTQSDKRRRLPISAHRRRKRTRKGVETPTKKPRHLDDDDRREEEKAI